MSSSLSSSSAFSKFASTFRGEFVKTGIMTIFTDCEPDDLLFLHLLFKWICQNVCYLPNRYEINIICSITTTPEKKCEFLNDWIKSDFPNIRSHIRLFQGEKDESVFSYTLGPKISLKSSIMIIIMITLMLMLTGLYATVFGFALFIFACVFAYQYLENQYEVFNKYLIHDYSLIVSLAPINPLVHMYLEDPNIFSKTFLVMYGSFNVRNMITKSQNPEQTAAQIYDWMHSFQKVYYFESYYTVGPCNKVQTINKEIPDEVKRVFEIHPEIHNLMNDILLDIGRNTFLHQAMIEWNHNIVSKCNPNNQFEARIINSIKTSDYNQFVAADWLIMLILMNEQNYLDCFKREDLGFFSNGRPITDRVSETSNVYRFVGEPNLENPSYVFFKTMLNELNFYLIE